MVPGQTWGSPRHRHGPESRRKRAPVIPPLIPRRRPAIVTRGLNWGAYSTHRSRTKEVLPMTVARRIQPVGGIGVSSVRGPTP